MSDILKHVQKAIGDTPLMVSGNLRDLLCSSAYANDHVIALLLRDVAHNAIAAVFDAIAELSEAQMDAALALPVTKSVSGAMTIAAVHGWAPTVEDRPNSPLEQWYRAMIAALRSEIE